MSLGLCHFPSKDLDGDGDLLFEWYKSRNVIVRVTSTTKVDVDHGIVQQKNTPLKTRNQNRNQASKQTNKTSKKKPPKFDKMRHTTNNTRFAIDLSWKDQFYVFKGMWHTIRYYYCKREREIFMISKVLMVFFKWMSSIWITCMIYGLFSDINTIDTLNYEYQLRTFWKTHAYDTLRLIMGLYNFWGVHAREKLHKHYKATKLLERHTISRSGWQKGNRWMKTKQQTPSWVRGKGMYIWGAMIRVESAPNVIKGLS